MRSRRVGGNPEIAFLGAPGRIITTEELRGKHSVLGLVKEKGSN